jgi:hypothetical protein
MPAQFNHGRNCSQKNQQAEQNWEPSPEAHVGMGKNDSIRGSCGGAPSPAKGFYNRVIR